MKILNSKIHGIIDYLVVAFLWLSPTLFGLEHTSAIFTYALGGIHLILTVLTDFDYGIIKVIPLKVHGWIELIVAIALGGVAYYFHTIGDDLAHNFYLCFAGAVLLTWLLTDYRMQKV